MEISKSFPPQTDWLTRLSLALVAGVMVTITLIYYGLHAGALTDNARLDPMRPFWRPDGVQVDVVESTPRGLAQGDIVIGVEGLSLETWVQALFHPGGPRLKLQPGEALTYTVIRGDQVAQVQVVYSRFPLTWVLIHRWGTLLFVLITQVVGAFVFIRRPDDPAARLLFLFGFLACHTYAWSLGLFVSDLLTRTGFWLYSLLTPGAWILFWCVAVHFSLVFPQPHPFLKAHPKSPILIYVAGYALFCGYLTFSWYRKSNVLEWMGTWSRGGYFIALLYLSLMMALLLWAYFTNQHPVSREKIRWVMYGAFISGLGGLFLWILPPLLINRPVISANTLGLLVSIFPVALAMAILRHHLFDIDLIINRTLVYAALTGTLAGIYFVLVVLFQILIRFVTTEDSPLAIVASTLIIAALFNTLRRRIQNDIDRRFFRHKYDAQKTIESFSMDVRDEVELEAMTAHLLKVVEDSMQPESLSIWVPKYSRMI